MKTALINLFTAFVLIAIELTIMYYSNNKANGIWDEIITLIASWETFAIIVMWKPKKARKDGEK